MNVDDYENQDINQQESMTFESQPMNVELHSEVEL